MVRMRPDGSLLFNGRRDCQVKVRGHRVELGEVESLMRAHPAVLDAAVTTFPNENGSSGPVGYYVSRTAQEIPAAEWRTYLRKNLPEYMVPAAYVSLSSIPLTANGKLNRSVLLRPKWDHRTGTNSVPNSDVEQTILNVWKEVLAASQIGTNDNFFDVGGHSLLLTKVQMRLRELLGEDIPMVRLYRYPTVSLLAQHISANGLPAASQAARRGEARRRILLGQSDGGESLTNSALRPK